MTPALCAALERALGEPVTGATPLGGGDINDAHRVVLASGREVFVKSHDRAAPRMFSCEARGLAWLAEPRAIRVPEVLAVSEPDAPLPHFLVLEFIARGRKARDFDDELGRGLARLHAAGAPCFGLGHDNFIGTLDQANAPVPTWSEFYAERRLLPQVRMARERGLGPGSWPGAFERLAGKLGELVGPQEPPARLHGDLWSGNVHTDERGQPCLIDPAVYGGHREVDLAMLTLFGGLTPRMLAAYDEVYPLAPRREDRVALYQLYPLLVHVNLFGGGYVDAVESALGRYV